MNKSTISEQLQHDYPDYKIYLDAANRMVVADDHKMSLLNSSSALQSMNIFSRSGRSFYQAIAQLLCTQYNIIPKEGSYADTLIIRQEDLNKYKAQKLAKEWGIGFLEDNEEILAIEVDDGVERNFLLGSADEVEEEYKKEPFQESGRSSEDKWAELEEINFDAEMKYLEKGIEFAAAMEEVENAELAIKTKLEKIDNNNLAEELSPIVSTGGLKFIRRIFIRRKK